MTYDVQRIRARFPGLARTRNGASVAFLDNPAGTQVPASVTGRMVEAMHHGNANLGGLFDTSVEAGAAVDAAHRAAAVFVNAAGPEEVFFGQNMTTLTFAMSRSIGRTLSNGDEIVLSRMDHDANVSPWLMMAEERGVTVKWLDFSPESFEFDLSALEAVLTERTRLVAVCHASNVLGTINDIAGIAHLAHSVGALVYVDAVQSAPHVALDVQALGCDFLVCSAYKFFGPHYGLFWGRRDLLDRLTPYKVRAASDDLPSRFVTGTTNREQLAGIHAAIDYIASLADEAGDASNDPRVRLEAGYAVMRAHDDMLASRLVDGVASIRGARILGISDKAAFKRRVSTVSFTLPGVASLEFERRAAELGLQLWSGHNYGIEPVGRLGLLESGGGIRVGPVHYNTVEEIDRVVRLAEEIVAGR